MLPSPTHCLARHPKQHIFLGLGAGVDWGGTFLNINVNVKTSSDVQIFVINQIQVKPHESLGDHQCKQSSQPPENQIILEFGNN